MLRPYRLVQALRSTDKKITVPGFWWRIGSWGVGDWRKLHNEELHDTYCSVNVIRVIRANKMRLVEHVARTEEK